jgi:type VI secretion system protein ImpM
MDLSLPGYLVTVWVFGKMPAHGDFVGRGLDSMTRATLDAWLSGEMAAARAAAGEDFDTHYDQSPPWRFAELLDGGGWRVGAMCPSVDSVGRRFPLLVAREVETADCVADVAFACELCLYDAFDGGWDADALAKSIAAINPDGKDGSVEPGWWTEGSEIAVPNRISGARPQGLVGAMIRGDWT